MQEKQEVLERIGAKLREIRKEAGYKNHEEFAWENKLSRVHYWRIEKGNTNVTIGSLLKVLAVHELDIEEFFCDIKNNPPSQEKKDN